MVDSIINDIRNTFYSGNMVSKIILVNIALFISINLFCIFSSTGLCTTVSNGLSLPSNPSQLIWQPWSLFTHMILHKAFFHILWNMLLLYWFGQIAGDLLGDDRILPIYIMSGLFGGLVYICHDLFLPGGTGGAAHAMGASAAVMAIIWTAAMTAPDYNMRLLFLGNVPLKYIALGLLFMDLLGSAGDINKGGHFAHIGGALFGMLFVYFLRKGTDLTAPFTNRGQMKRAKAYKQRSSVEKTPRSKFKVVHNKKDQNTPPKPAFNQQAELDRILDKINDKGYENLTAEEKDFLYRASKKK